MTVFTIACTAKSIMQFGIFVFVEAQEKNMRGNLQGSKCDGDCVSMKTFFRFTKRFHSPLDAAGFFRNIFTPTPGDVFN